MTRMHTKGLLVALAMTALAFSGCLSEKATLPELMGDRASGSDLFEAAQQAQGAARRVPIVETPAAEPEEEVSGDVPADDQADESPAPPADPDGDASEEADDVPETDGDQDASDEGASTEDAGEPSDDAQEPSSDETSDDQASDDASTDETPAQSEEEPPENDTASEDEQPQAEPDRDCESEVVVDHSKSIFYWKTHASTSDPDRTQYGAQYRLLSDDVVASGIAFGLEDANDFCHIEDAYPCVFSDPVWLKGEDSLQPSDAWRQPFGFTNVHTGLEEGSDQGTPFHYTDLVVRGWARLSDGTLVLDSDPDVGNWGDMRVYDKTGKAGRESDTSGMCDLVEAGILPPE